MFRKLLLLSRQPCTPSTTTILYCSLFLLPVHTKLLATGRSLIQALIFGTVYRTTSETYCPHLTIVHILFENIFIYLSQKGLNFSWMNKVSFGKAVRGPGADVWIYLAILLFQTGGRLYLTPSRFRCGRRQCPHIYTYSIFNSPLEPFQFYCWAHMDCVPLAISMDFRYFWSVWAGTSNLPFKSLNNTDAVNKTTEQMESFKKRRLQPSRSSLLFKQYLPNFATFTKLY